MEEIKLETNKLLLQSEFRKNTQKKLKIKRKLDIGVNHLNKSARFKRLVDLIESNASNSTTKNENDLNEFQPSLPNDSNSKIVLPIKPVLRVDTDSPNLVNLTWDVINAFKETDNSKYANEDEMYSSIKEYEIYSYKLNLSQNNSGDDSNKWTKVS